MPQDEGSPARKGGEDVTLHPSDAPFACSSCGERKLNFRQAQTQRVLGQPILCHNCKPTMKSTKL